MTSRRGFFSLISALPFVRKLVATDRPRESAPLPRHLEYRMLNGKFFHYRNETLEPIVYFSANSDMGYTALMDSLIA